MVGTGLASAALGFFLGGMAGAELETRSGSCCSDSPGLGGFLVGSVAGPAILVPLTVHAANGGGGSLPSVLGVAAAVGMVGYLSLASTTPWVYLATPLVQVIAAVAVEESTSR